MKKVFKTGFWVLFSLCGAWAYATIAFHRNEHINSVYILIAAICSYVIGFRFYSKWIAAKVLALDDKRATPCEVHEDGKDYVRTNKWIVFGHHFAAISGPGPLVGPVLAAQFGYLPGTLWILIGAVLGGAVQDFVILAFSMRRDGKSLGKIVKDEINTPAGLISLVGILAIMTILLAVLALVVVKALAESPWGVFTVGATIPIAMFMGGYMRFIRVGKVLEASAIGVVLLLLAVWGGKLVYADREGLSKIFTISAEPLAWTIIIYGLAASVLPVWLLLAPRDYLSTFMKLGTIFILAIGCFFVLPDLKFPAISRFIDGSGLVVAGKLFPFCFITIACGAISGFHTLISSGVTPKIITRETYARGIGYGAMCLESLVAIMAMIAACTLEPGVYLSMNVKGVGDTYAAVAADTIAKVTAAGFPISIETMENLAKQLGEHTLFGRTGGAATLAVGMSFVLSTFTHGKWLDLWYHFAIMFEALFILTTLDAGTRVGRYILHDALGHLWKPLGDTKNIFANILASGIMVSLWGYFLIQGVRDPLGGVNSLWPLFGIANQMLAVIALCLATTIILKSCLLKLDSQSNLLLPVILKKTAPALIALLPMIWLLSVTFTAGYQKIFHPDPKIGFISAAKKLEEKSPSLQKAMEEAIKIGDATKIKAAETNLKANRALIFNNKLDAVVAATFITLVSIIVLLSIKEWIMLIARKRAPQLHESPVVWLPDYAVVEGKPIKWLGWLTLFMFAIKEISGQAQVERAEKLLMSNQCVCHHHNHLISTGSISPEDIKKQAFLNATDHRFRNINRCC
ncbi:MAG: carbon starvation protein A [Verrucomicrobiae bacterium]|nr:carbon starvation protein A [Verrucomicrobiae bacterium]